MNGVRIPEAQEGDGLALQCLSDIHGTAAIIKEIIFNNSFRLDPRHGFVSLDLGSGTGILTLAAAIAGMRNGAKDIFCTGTEMSNEAIPKSRRVLSNISDRLQHDGILSFNILRADISRMNVGSVLGNQPLSFWLSETFHNTTPQFDITETGVKLIDDKAEVVTAINSQNDPFPQVLDRTIKTIPGFIDDVKRGKTAMFPNIMNGLFVPSEMGTKLTLTTDEANQPLTLDQVGEEFKEYEKLTDNERWGRADNLTDEGRLALLKIALDATGIGPLLESEFREVCARLEISPDFINQLMRGAINSTNMMQPEFPSNIPTMNMSPIELLSALENSIMNMANAESNLTTVMQLMQRLDELSTVRSKHKKPRKRQLTPKNRKKIRDKNKAARKSRRKKGKKKKK